MVIKVVIPSTFYKPLMWCYLCLTIVTHSHFAQKKKSFLWYITPEFSSLNVMFSACPCPYHFFFNSILLQSQRTSFNILLFQNSLGVVFVFVFCLYFSAHDISSILGKITFFSNGKILFLSEDFTQISPLNVATPQGPQTFSLIVICTDLLYNIYTW